MTGIVLQARMGSSRLPGKVLMELCGRPILGHILDRLRLVGNADTVIVATTTRGKDDPIQAFVEKEGVHCFRGNEADVLDRYYRAAISFGLCDIVRATADNPLVDPEEIDRLITLHKQSGADYTHAFGLLPVGVGAECFTFKALERAWREGLLPNHREHVNEYIQEHPELFRIRELDVPEIKWAPTIRLTVDTRGDFERMKAVYEALYRPGRVITTEEAIGICSAFYA
ncbi:MAG: NTP transferase domain-containing protein [Nitrospirales bacterium]|nr:NTP transferase domain-containing protein [Nitrospirales bacterium]